MNIYKRITNHSPGLLMITLLLLFSCGSESYWDALKDVAASSAPLSDGIYVNAATGSDTASCGSPESPCQTITFGLNEAISQAKSAVRVASGTYTETINVLAGISLHGGYSASNWRDRDITLAGRANPTYMTVIDQPAGTVLTCDGTLPNLITSATVIEGFTLRGVSTIACINNASPKIVQNTIYSINGPNSYGISIISSTPVIQFNAIIGGNGGANNSFGLYIIAASNPTISGNIIQGNSAASLINSYGIYIDASGPTIVANQIYGGSAGTASYGMRIINGAGPTIAFNIIHGEDAPDSYGVYFDASGGPIISNSIRGGIEPSVLTATGIFNTNSAAPKIINNVIYGGMAANAVIGINNSVASSTSIYNNTIDAGISGTSTAAGIRIADSSPNIINNIITVQNGPLGTYGIYEATVNSDPALLNNNDIFSCATALYHDADVPGDLTTAVQLNDNTLTNLMGPAASSGNISVPLTFDADYRILGAAVPADLPLVTQGGLDLTGFFDNDRDDNARNAPWSMGAYEY